MHYVVGPKGERFFAPTLSAFALRSLSPPPILSVHPSNHTIRLIHVAAPVKEFYIYSNIFRTTASNA